MRRDIATVLHCYDLRWAREWNDFISTLFTSPIRFKEYRSYLPGRSMQHYYVSRLLPILRSKKIVSLFFVNYLEDFSVDFVKAAYARNIYGFVRGSNFEANETIGLGGSLINYEKAIMPIATRLFVATELIREYIPNSIVIGEPILWPFREPNNNDLILFNHRLNKDKNPMLIGELPKEIQKRFVISAPKGQTDYIHRAKNFETKRFYFRPDDFTYKTIISQCGYVVSFAKFESWGQAIMDGVANGLCPLVWDRETNCYRYNIIDECRFTSLDEFIDKLRYFDSNPDKRTEAVLKQQDSLKQFKKDEWAKTLLSHLPRSGHD